MKMTWPWSRVRGEPEISTIGGNTIVNDSGVPTSRFMDTLGGMSGSDDPIKDALVTWKTTILGGAGADRRRGTLFDRDQFVCPENPYEQMKVAYNAADDDIVGSFLDASEALAFSSVKMECDDPDEQVKQRGSLPLTGRQCTGHG